ncbi:MAG: RNA polymerase sigma-70 factor (ECF subfamily) [Verrucomicrobiales bacterium]|jgi:RNA polymerase sigma-70 factor (ECF subfamily)
MTDHHAPSGTDLRVSDVDSVRLEELVDSQRKPPFDMADCLDAVAECDAQASEQLMAFLYPVVIRIIRGRISRQLAEEDVAQDVFVKVFRKFGQYRRDVPIEHWVSKIAVTTCLNAMRGKRVRLELRRADLSEAEDQALDRTRGNFEEASTSDAVASKELLGKLLDHLSAKDRLVIEMLELEGRTSEEAARLLETSAVALRVRATRARSKLRKHLQQLLGETTP